MKVMNLFEEVVYGVSTGKQNNQLVICLLYLLNELVSQALHNTRYEVYLLCTSAARYCYALFINQMIGFLISLPCHYL